MTVLGKGEYHDITSPEYAERHFEASQLPPKALATPFGTMTELWCGDEGGHEGLAKGWVVTIGGGTGSGKSLMALNFSKAAIADGATVGFLSLEMSHRQLATRFYAMLAGIPAYKLEQGKHFDLHAAEKVKRLLLQGSKDVPGGPKFLVNEDPLPELGRMMEMMEEWRGWRCDFFVVDYLQLCSSPNEQGQSRELADITGALRIFAKENGARILGLSQYTLECRRAMRKDNRQPTHDDFIGSSAISNNSHLCLCLDGSRYERVQENRPGSPRTDVARTWLVNSKSRVGPTGEIPIEWDYRTLTVREATPDEEHQWPE